VFWSPKTGTHTPPFVTGSTQQTNKTTNQPTNQPTKKPSKKKDGSRSFDFGFVTGANTVCHPSDIKGCSEEEVLFLEQQKVTTLPWQYKEFLRAMGHGAGRFLAGTHEFFSSLDGVAGGGRCLVEL
jgi:hypothetical protein